MIILRSVRIIAGSVEYSIEVQPQLDPILLGSGTEFSDHVIRLMLVAVPERLVSAIKLMNVASSNKFEI